MQYKFIFCINSLLLLQVMINLFKVYGGLCISSMIWELHKLFLRQWMLCLVIGPKLFIFTQWLKNLQDIFGLVSTVNVFAVHVSDRCRRTKLSEL
jgi:hypothetical protein